MNNQKELTEKLRSAADAYYNGQPIMSDLEFDKSLEQLKKMEQESGIVLDNSPTLSVGAKVVDSLERVNHEFPALSLDKVKYADRENLKKFLGERQGILSWKMDGLTVVATYLPDGKGHSNLSRVVTRGDGYIGSDVTHNAVFYKGLPHTLPIDEKIVVRGEAVMSFEEFNRVNEASDGVYENARNLASATVQMLDANESQKREITFTAFEFVTGYGDTKYQSDRFKTLEMLGFNVVEHTLVDKVNILTVVDYYMNNLKDNAFPTDGLVISYNDMEYGMSLGNTEHHFRHSIALKWSDETKETVLRSIEWSVGKTGIVTPVAIFDSVRLGLGSNVTRASLHNLSIMKRIPAKNGAESHLMIGSKVEVYLANMIIPQIASCEGGDTEIEIPSFCPVCNSPLHLVVKNGTETIHCNNASCGARVQGKLENAVSKDGLDIKGLGGSQIKDLLSTGLINGSVSSILDLGNIKELPEQLKDIDGWGEKSWSNLVDAINKAKHTTLKRYLYALNIPLLGNDLSKKLSARWNSVEAFLDFAAFPLEYLLKDIDGVGEIKAQGITDWCFKNYSEAKSLAEHLTFEEKTSSNDNSLAGVTFVITGDVHEYKNRDEFKESVEKRGGKVSGSVSKKTSYLVINDLSSTTGKAAKARELNIPMISEDEFIERFGR